MDSVFIGGFLFCLCLLAIDDWKTRKLHDTDIGLLWCSLALLGWTGGNVVAAFAFAGFSFACSYMLLYSLQIYFFKKPLLRGGDILIFPPFVAFCALVAGPIGFGWAACVLGISLIVSYKKELPFAAMLFGAALVCLILPYLSGFAASSA